MASPTALAVAAAASLDATSHVAVAPAVSAAAAGIRPRALLLPCSYT